KAVIGPVAADKLVVGAKNLPVELVPVAAGAELKFQFLASGKSQADTEVTVITPDGKSAKVKTDATGHTPAFSAPGRYGAWAKSVIAAPGSVGDKKYEEARHYATVVVDVPAK
ncbi:MAG TPA: DUF4198 domain-containing protein, partial [Urbifossiella sp.]|nr:DUF4198 domain-containing protein [Urbifossiella sp.]